MLYNEEEMQNVSYILRKVGKIKQDQGTLIPAF